MSADMEKFVDATKANLREGAEWSFDLVSNTWKAVETLNTDVFNALDAKWRNLRSRFVSLRFRVQGGVRQFYEASTGKWTRLTQEMEDFATASKANFREGITWVFDTVANSWKAIDSNLQAAASAARARDAASGYKEPAGPVRAADYGNVPRAPSGGSSYTTPRAPPARESYNSAPVRKAGNYGGR